jgi:hypothetical protein
LQHPPGGIAEQSAWVRYTTDIANLPAAGGLGTRFLAATAVELPALPPFPGLPAQPRLELVMLQGPVVGAGAGHHFIPISVIEEFRAVLSTQARDLALGWISGQTSPNHRNTTIGTITHALYNTAVRAEMQAYITGLNLPAGGRMTQAQMEAFIARLDALPANNDITRYNTGIRAQRARFVAANAGALATPATTADRITRGRSYLPRLASMLMMVAASNAIAQYAGAANRAADSRFFRSGMQALSEGNLDEAQSNRGFGRIGAGGFMGELTDNGLTLAATAFETAWDAALKNATRRAAAINRGD